eukprot:TRINITY_DN29634_c5_g1_i1.p1 TRINITY_DN29634_c5_g1~~TRINITY_DN29634_c5_g1_i1.p1  ORF type:complete len:161 (-),score=6.93 TRINITY_DN29634_c5_g1_i1:4-486(-)
MILSCLKLFKHDVEYAISRIMGIRKINSFGKQSSQTEAVKSISSIFQLVLHEASPESQDRFYKHIVHFRTFSIISMSPAQCKLDNEFIEKFKGTVVAMCNISDSKTHQRLYQKFKIPPMEKKDIQKGLVNHIKRRIEEAVELSMPKVSLLLLLLVVVCLF